MHVPSEGSLNVEPDHLYLVYRVTCEDTYQTHAIIDLTLARSTILIVKDSLDRLISNRPPAIKDGMFELNAELEDAAVILLDLDELEDQVDSWEYNHEDRLYDIVDKLTGDKFDPDSTVSMLSGADLLDLIDDVSFWEGSYATTLVFRVDESRRDLYVSPKIAVGDGFPLFSAGSFRRWSFIDSVFQERSQV